MARVWRQPSKRSGRGRKQAFQGSRFGSSKRYRPLFGERARKDHGKVVESRRRAGAGQRPALVVRGQRLLRGRAFARSDRTRSWAQEPRRNSCTPAVRAGGIVIAYLQVEGRDLELRREFPQRLLGWDTLPGLEAAEVGIGDARRGELTLREAALLAQPPDARADRLGSFPRHASQRRCGAASRRARRTRARRCRRNSSLIRLACSSLGRWIPQNGKTKAPCTRRHEAFQ